MGQLRVLLAVLVVLEHTGGLGGYMDNGGPLAVQAFFTISGFYMALILNERYATPETNRLFWANRALRIYTLYYAFLALYLLVFLLSEAQGGRTMLAQYVDPALDLGDRLFLAALQVTVVGQDYALHVAWDQAGELTWTDQPYRQGGNEVYKFMVIPVAWALAIELYFYALAPFLVRRPIRQLVLLAGISMAARVIAALFGVYTEPYSYRFFPFELSLFLVGAIAYRVFAANPERWTGTRAWVMTLSTIVGILAFPILLGDWDANVFFTPARIVVLAVVVVSLPAIHGLSRHSELDRRIGQYSYPIYLNHILVLALFGRASFVAGHPVRRTLCVVIVSALLSWAAIKFLEAPVEALRTRIRRRAVRRSGT